MPVPCLLLMIATSSRCSVPSKTICGPSQLNSTTCSQKSSRFTVLLKRQSTKSKNATRMSPLLRASSQKFRSRSKSISSRALNSKKWSTVSLTTWTSSKRSRKLWTIKSSRSRPGLWLKPSSLSKSLRHHLTHLKRKKRVLSQSHPKLQSRRQRRKK